MAISVTVPRFIPTKLVKILFGKRIPFTTGTESDTVMTEGDMTIE